MTTRTEKLFSGFFRAAAVYNVLWAAVVVFFPNLLFELFRVPIG